MKKDKKEEKKKENPHKEIKEEDKDTLEKDSSDSEVPVNEEKLEKQLIKIFAFFGALILIFVIAYSIPGYFAKKQSQFEYEGLEFSKVQIEGIPFYHYSFYYDKGGGYHQYNLYLRKDPRTNNVPVEGEIVFDKKDIYIGIDNDALTQCEDGVIASAALAGFLKGNNLNVKAGEANTESAIAKRSEWISCERRYGSKAIEIIPGDETRVISSGDCTRIFVNNCEVLEGTEKFMVQAILDAKKKAGS